MWDYFPTMFIMAIMSTITMSPAADTAAAVSAPLIAAAIVRPERIKQITSIKTAPRGVLIALIMPPAAPPGMKQAPPYDQTKSIL